MKNKCRSLLGEARKSPAYEGDCTDDRLSDLPDCVLYQILSLLDTKAVVRTCVLSRRWRCVWKHVPAIDLNCCSFDNCLERFCTFVDKVLSSRHPTNVVDRIRYCDGEDVRWGASEDYDRLAVKVIEYAVSHETQELDLFFCCDCEAAFQLPESCTSLTANCNLRTLYLDGLIIDKRFKYFGFGLLTTLELCVCTFVSDEEVVDPFSEFPCLNKLVCKMCYGRNESKTVRIAGPQLQNLELENVSFETIAISAPKLKSFELLSTARSLEFSELNLPSLVDADVDIDPYFQVDCQVTAEDLVVLFQGCHNVKSLTVGHSIIQTLCEDFELLNEEPAPFTRLENLKLEWSSSDIPYKMVSY